MSPETRQKRWLHDKLFEAMWRLDMLGWSGKVWKSNKHYEEALVEFEKRRLTLKNENP
jgi:hypothetical protein